MALRILGSMSKVSNKKFISVFIPTYNGDKYISECIASISAQVLPEGYDLEILVTDSGSTDSTVEILKSFGNKILLSQIPNSDFGHGKTRSQAAKTARGEFILFLSQDATPATSDWIKYMVEPFFLSEQVGIVFGKQIPRPDVAATIKREVSTVFGGLGAQDSIVIQRNKSLIDGSITNSINTFFSDVNSAARTNLLVDKVPFRDVNYAEDQALAEDMQNAGYLKAYSPRGAVLHSNEYNVREYYKRKFDEYIGLQESTNLILKTGIRPLLVGWIRPTLYDYRFIRKDNEYTLKSKLLWFAKSPLYNIALQLGKRAASKHLNNHSKRNRISLESGRRT